VKKEFPKKIIISRTDSIGDVVLTLPLCAWLKKEFPKTKITFLCKNYTIPILSNVEFVDQIISVDNFVNSSESEQIAFFVDLKADWILHVFPNKKIARLAKKAKIKNRVGTSHRLFHFFTCNQKVSFTRKRSSLHEAQLNFYLLQPLGLKKIPSFFEIRDIHKQLRPFENKLPNELSSFLCNQKVVILHPKSQGSALEWPIDKYISLSKSLVSKGVGVVFTGTENEGSLFRSLIPEDKLIIDSTGKLNLQQLMFLISQSNAIVACSTGPLHIGGLCGIQSIGLFSQRKPIHPGRWKPLGEKSQTLVYDENCKPCSLGKMCNCIEKITIDEVINKLSY